MNDKQIKEELNAAERHLQKAQWILDRLSHELGQGETRSTLSLSGEFRTIQEVLADWTIRLRNAAYYRDWLTAEERLARPE